MRERWAGRVGSGAGRRHFCVLLLFALLLGLGSASPPAAAQEGDHHAGLVVQFADGGTRQYCVAFAEESITGLDLLLKSGLDVKVESYGSMGALVCKIGADGCDFPAQPCACLSYGPGGVYWSYSHLKDGAWKVATQGAAGYKIRDGDVDGWAWSSGKAPALATFAQICPAVQTQPSQTPQAPQEQPTATSTPTAKSEPPTAIPTPTHPRSTPTRRPPTVTLPPTRTSTPLPPRPTRSQQPVELTAPSAPRPSSTPPPPTHATSTSTSSLTSTPLPPAPTETPAGLPTAEPTHTPSPSPTLRPTDTSTATPAAQSTAIQVPDPQPPTGSLAQTLGIGIGLAVIGGLLVWRLVRAKGRTRP